MRGYFFPILLLTALAGCTSDTAPIEVPSVRVALSQSLVKLGDSVTISVTTTNTTNAPVTLRNDRFCPDIFEVISGPRVVAPGLIVCPGIYVPPIVLNAGESRTTSIVWRAEIYNAGAGQPSQLLPGTYQIRGRVFSGSSYVHSTNAPEIQIVPSND